MGKTAVLAGVMLSPVTEAIEIVCQDPAHDETVVQRFELVDGRWVATIGGNPFDGYDDEPLGGVPLTADDRPTVSGPLPPPGLHILHPGKAVRTRPKIQCRQCGRPVVIRDERLQQILDRARGVFVANEGAPRVVPLGVLEQPLR